MLLTEKLDLALREGKQDNIDNCFRGEAMVAEFDETEIIAGEEELGDLTPSIRQMFAQADDTADDLIGVIRRFAFAEQGLVLGDSKFAADRNEEIELIDGRPMFVEPLASGVGFVVGNGKRGGGHVRMLRGRIAF